MPLGGWFGGHFEVVAGDSKQLQTWDFAYLLHQLDVCLARRLTKAQFALEPAEYSTDLEIVLNTSPFFGLVKGEGHAPVVFSKDHSRVLSALKNHLAWVLEDDERDREVLKFRGERLFIRRDRRIELIELRLALSDHLEELKGANWVP